MPGWFPTERFDTAGWRLEGVGLLAVLGESSVADQAQPLTASKLSLLPRLIPAPQALLRATRPVRLPSPPAVVCGVHSGTLVHELNYFPNIIHPIADLKPYQVVVYEISWAEKRTKYEKSQSIKLEKLIMPEGLRSKRPVSVPPPHKHGNKYAITPNKWSPLSLITISSFLMTACAFAWALVIRDGTAAVAIFLMSMVSTLNGFAFYWKPHLAVRPSSAVVPRGDIIIRTREGAFIVVRCTEELARELYTGTEECNYSLSEQWARVLVGIGTFLIMFAVVLLGNCEWTMQAVVSAIYMLMNAMYWGSSLMPKSWIWDMSRYDWKDVTPDNVKAAHEIGSDGAQPSFTRTLWYAIHATEEINWVIVSGAVPQTQAWENWLELAYANRTDPDWDAVGEKDRLMAEARRSQLVPSRKDHDS
ncbi:TPA_exp: Uncharacterized protein A8136_2244 [Trichophyton benhamiae CBS 112371]|uniref:Uncharacterized protein n=2 Tax=Trichophyton TaxID=5550 RepID=D4AYM1_ARTBC|nr:uncharacterized protein ARB_01290 [Trichophyton benhamiae CBS 112371]XP_003024700.1 uncharacterized protein TRV_01163 [Trichophyton verrucosum HKI 0517]EFE31691.1 conserved hypothetical protein [Trichophyton benhamiae CBS 112371]EFE44089.1 conserved hypothetical protein [Trichophyton verrucosum HKI 0517]DAA74826.1 TPA_exp: Uncharacterized protein A8136_2244 [Trichophyton benhamiae CBS 112371]